MADQTTTDQTPIAQDKEIIVEVSLEELSEMTVENHREHINQKLKEQGFPGELERRAPPRGNPDGWRWKGDGSISTEWSFRRGKLIIRWSPNPEPELTNI